MNFFSKLFKPKPILAQVTIATQIFTGNLGEGWDDVYKTANAFAVFLKNYRLNELKSFIKYGHQIEIDIDIQRASGYDKGTKVYVDGVDGELASKLQHEIESAMLDTNILWTFYCESQVRRITEETHEPILHLN